MSIAEPTAADDAPPPLTPRSPRPDGRPRLSLAGRLPDRAAVVEALRGDPLVQNSAYITVSTGLMGVLGFAFWVLCARLFDPAEVGLGSSLVSASPLLSYLGLLGFQNAFVYYLPTLGEHEADDFVSTGVNLVLVAAAVVAAGYVLAVPVIAPELDLLRTSPLTALGFIACSAALAGNLLTDSYFIAYRSAVYNLVTDGVVQSLLKLVLPLVLVGMGAFGIFTATGLGGVAALVLSLVIMGRRFGFRWRPVVSRSVLRRTWSFAAGNYAASILNLLPLLVLPVIILRARGAVEVGLYYVAFQVTNLLNAISYAIAQSMNAEGSQPGIDVGALARRSARLMAGAVGPAVAVVVLAAPLVLLPFGSEYGDAAAPLAVMALGCLAVGANVWASTLLRVTRGLGWLVVANVVFVAVSCGGAALVAGRGLTWVAAAWFAGNAACAAVSGVGLRLRDRGRGPGRFSRPAYVVIARGPEPVLAATGTERPAP